jgi:heat shock protein 5
VLFAAIFGVYCVAVPFAMAQEVNNRGPIIGIDLGTTYSCVGVYKSDGNVEIVANDQGNRITPSYVSFSETNERLVGDAAKNQATINPENTVFDVKRLIGREYNDDSVQEDKKLFPFNIVSNKEGKPRIQIDQNDKDSVMYAPEEISSMILAKVGFRTLSFWSICAFQTFLLVAS